MKENNPIDQVIEKISIVDFIGRYIPVKKTGKNYMAVCPFHNDRGPSLSISDDKGLFHCFGCGKSGNVITFLMEYENIPFKEALEQLAREAGVTLRERPKNEARDRLYRLNEAAASFFFDTLMASEEARQARLYLKERKVSKKIIETFRLGYAPASGNLLCRKLEEKGASMEEMDRLFLAREGKSGPFDLFRDRIMFPIYDPGGNVIAFGGRSLHKEQKPKYLNSGETPLFKKSQTLYGLHLTRREIFASRSAVVVEGYMDLLALYQYGIKNVVAVLGTAFTRGHADLLKNRVDDIYLFFDNDEAGQRATIRSLEQLFNTGINTWVVINSLEKDPDDIVRTRGSAFIEKLVHNAVPGFDFYVDYFTSGIDMDNPEQKSSAYKKMKSDFIRLSDEERRAFFLQALDARFGRETAWHGRKRKKGRNAVAKGDFRKDEVLFLLYFLENETFSRKLAELQDDWTYYIKDRRILEALALACDALLKGEPIHGRGKYEHFVENPLLLREMTALLFREA
ncbi:MAG TPA: DNA primase, partial [Firmicutes bacterium]|nr:DNA primase [Bacillota bacterium]